MINARLAHARIAGIPARMRRRMLLELSGSGERCGPFAASPLATARHHSLPRSVPARWLAMPLCDRGVIGYRPDVRVSGAAARCTGRAPARSAGTQVTIRNGERHQA
jgi:hypothetical protein